MQTLSSFTRKFPLLFGIIASLVFICAIYLFTIPNFGLWTMPVQESILALAAVVIALLFIIPSPFIFSAKGAKFAFKKSIYYLIITCLIGIFSIVAALAGLLETSDLTFSYVLNAVLAATLLAIATGVFEELVFRVFLFGGLLAKWGSTTKGVILAAVVSSLVFGLVHVFASFFTGSLGLIEIGQIIGKTIQAGVFGFLCCAIYLKTRNFIIIAVIHAINDYLLFIGAFLGATSIGNYVNGDNYMTLIMYCVYIILYIPVIIMCIKMLKQVKIPERGVLLSEDYKPRLPE